MPGFLIRCGADNPKFGIIKKEKIGAECQLINIEMQLFNKYDIEKRTLFYWSRRYGAQLSEGDPYQTLKKCATIHILNYSALPNQQVHNVFHLREDRSAITLIDDLEIHFLELSKLSDTLPNDGGLENGLWFLNGIELEHWEALKKSLETC
ncbi:Rpn family recombination-promoting nuclease/putative transposase [Saccharibacillus endophyticus]